MSRLTRKMQDSAFRHSAANPFIPIKYAQWFDGSDYLKQEEPLSADKRSHVSQRPDDDKQQFTLLWLIVVIVSSAAMSYQLYDITRLYLQYDVVSELIVRPPKNVSMPGFSTCSRYVELLQADQIDKLYPGSDLATKIRSNRIGIMDTEQLLTIEDIFRLTPEPADILQACRFRTPDTFDLVKSTLQDCYNVFDIGKYFRQQFMCYAFRMKDPDLRFQYQDILNSLSRPGLFVQVTLDLGQFNRTTHSQMFIHSNDKFPRGRKSFPARVARKFDNHFSFDYVLMTNYRLEPPYTTMCLNWPKVTGYDSREDCVDRCLIVKTQNTLGKAPFVAIIAEPLDSYHSSTEDSRNVTFSNALKHLRGECDQICSMANCIERLHVTNFIRAQSTTNLRFSVFALSKPPLDISFAASMSLATFLIQFLSCFGIWFTVDFTSLFAIVSSAAQLVRLVSSWRERGEEKRAMTS
ncbi:hypothetical protein HDE_13132 [Halotydeus destructor]|nr:hypothetical protein HDE_13132 [Halotydeus destructor]